MEQYSIKKLNETKQNEIFFSVNFELINENFPHTRNKIEKDRFRSL